MKRFIITLFILKSLFSIGQKTNSTNNHLFWQPKIKLHYSDFKYDSKNDSIAKLYCDSINLCTSASLGLFCVVDIPKKKRLRKKKKDRVYIVPAFEYNSSYSITSDSIEIDKQKVVFDIFELSARRLRKELYYIDSIMNSAYVYVNHLKKYENDEKIRRKNIIREYTQDVYINNREGAYTEWKKAIDQELIKYEKYTTSKEECLRFIKGIPLEKGFILAPRLVGVPKK